MEDNFEHWFDDQDLAAKPSQIETARQIGDASFVSDARKELAHSLALKMRDPGKTERSMEREIAGMVRNESWRLRSV